MDKKLNLSKIIWFTGLSGTGKSTLSNSIYKKLIEKKYKVKKIDGDTFRKKKKNINNFSKKNIIMNNLNIIKEVEKIQKKFHYILISVISPFSQTRKFARKKFKTNYFEVNVLCNLNTLIRRDTKGLYKKAIDNKIRNLIGFKSGIKYQKSNYRVIKINTDKLSVQSSVKKILIVKGIMR